MEQKEIAQSLLKINAVGFSPDNLITFKSGIISPVYVDNRKTPFYPEVWSKIINGMKDLIEKNNIQFDVIAGIETGGIPHSAALGFLMNKPSVFVRKKPKDHGTKKMIEGGNVIGKKVLLIEDLITTGGSCLTGVEAIRNEGGEVSDTIVIVTYGFDESEQAFKNANVNLHPLVSFPIILEEATSMNLINENALEKVKKFLADPHSWHQEAIALNS